MDSCPLPGIQMKLACSMEEWVSHHLTNLVISNDKVSIFLFSEEVVILMYMECSIGQSHTMCCRLLTQRLPCRATNPWKLIPP